MAKKATVGISIVGRDHEGVVAAFTSYAFQGGANIEKITQNVIKGLFGMYLEVSFARPPERKSFDAGLQKLAKSHGMEVSAHHEDGTTKQIAVFVTREPHCLEAILAAQKSLRGGQVAVVVGNRKVTCINVQKGARSVRRSRGAQPGKGRGAIAKNLSRKEHRRHRPGQIPPPANTHAKLCLALSKPHHQRSPFTPACIPRRIGICAGARARHKDRRSHHALCDRKP